jgi:hypothetical protein
MTNEEWLEAIGEDEDPLYEVPDELWQDADFCLAVVKRNRVALRFVPWEKRTPELCLAAVKKDGAALRFVPGELRSAEICVAAVQQNGISRSALYYVPEELQEEVRKEAGARI